MKGIAARGEDRARGDSGTCVLHIPGCRIQPAVASTEIALVGVSGTLYTASSEG